MAHIAATRVKETSTTTGTAAYVLGGAEANHDAFSERLANTDTCFYIAIDQGGAGWEYGLGTYTSAGNTLARTTVKQSTNSDAAVSWAAGTRDILLFHPPLSADHQTVAALVIGTDVQAQNDILSDIAGLTQASDKGIYFDSATTAATFDLTAAGLALLDDADAGAQRTTLGLVIGTDVLAEKPIGIADNNLLEVDQAGGAASLEYARFTANGIESRSEAEFKGDFNLEIGTDV